MLKHKPYRCWKLNGSYDNGRDKSLHLNGYYWLLGHTPRKGWGFMFVDPKLPQWTGSSVEECLLKASIAGEDVAIEDVELHP